MKVTTILLALAAAVTAAPAADIVERQQTGGVVQFFYDDHCVYYAGQITINPSWEGPYHQKVGGPYGSRSAWFASPGKLVAWSIIGGKGEETHEPDVAKCVAYSDGIYASGDVATVVRKD